MGIEEMSILPRFDAVVLDDDCTRWACQRGLDDGSFETIGDFENETAAEEACDRLNDDLAKYEEALEAELAEVYGAKNQGANHAD